MICQFCKKREATIHFTNVENNKVYKIHICRQCAETQGFDELKKSNFEMGNLIAGLLDSSANAPVGRVKENTCPNCGASYVDFKRLGRLGCSQCYDFFKAQLLPLLRSIHGDTSHLGKVPKRMGNKVSLQRRVRVLQDELARAIEGEQYERAAELRDEIKKLMESGDYKGKSCRR